MNKPKVSIILTVCNGAKDVRASIESCLSQTYQNIELIIVDDCSTDETPQIIRSYKDARIKYIRNTRVQRFPRSLNIGFQHSSGEYLTWTSDEGRFLPTAVEEMLSFLENHPDVGLVYCDLYVLDFDTGQTLIRQLPDKLDVGKLNWLGYGFLYTRRVYEAIGGYNPDYDLVEGYDYWIRISKKFKMAHIPKALYLYGEHPGSLTNQRMAIVRLLDKLLKFHHGFVSFRELFHGMGEYLESAKGNAGSFCGFWADWFNVVKRIAKISGMDNVCFVLCSAVFSVKSGIQFLLNGILHFPREILAAQRIKEVGSGLKIFPDKKNVLCFIPAMAVGGSEKVVVSMIQGFNSEDHAFHLMTIKKENNKWCEAFCSNFRNSIVLNRMHSGLYFKYACAVTEKLNIDVVLISNASAAYHFLPRLKARFPHLKVIDILHLEDSVGARKESFFAVPYIDSRVCISEFLRNYMISKYGSSSVAARYKDRLKVIYNGTEMLENHKDRLAGKFKARHRIPEHTKIISFVHRFSSEKNPLQFIDIANELIKKTPPNTLKFVMAGDGKLYPDVKQKIDDLGIQDHFVLPGMLDDISELLSDTYLLLIVSGKEGIPLVMLEAMALQVPVITTDVGGIKEVLKEGINGHLVKLDDQFKDHFVRKALNLLENRHDYTKLAEHTRPSIYPEYSLAHMGRQYAQEFESLLKSNGKLV